MSISDTIKKGFRVLFDSNEKNCFFVISRKDGKVIRFPVKKGLYVRDDEEQRVNCNWTSVEGFTRREIERAQAAQKLYHDLNAENVDNVKFLSVPIKQRM